MTLDRHRSWLIPSIDFSGEGRLFLNETESGGHYPQSERPERTPIGHIQRYPDDQSYHSYDPRRESIRRKYRPREASNRFGDEVRNMSGTVSSVSAASLQRRLRRLKRGNSVTEKDLSNTGTTSWEGVPNKHERDMARQNGEPFSSLRNKPKHKQFGGTPQMNYPGSIGRKGQRGSVRSLDMEAIRKYKESLGRKSSMLEMYKNSVSRSNANGNAPLITEVPIKNKKLAEEKLPGLFFIISGLMMIGIGVTKILISYWHEFASTLITGVLLLILGIIGVTHKGDYLTKWKNGVYIAFGLLSSLAVLATVGILLHVIIPMLQAFSKVPEKPNTAVHDLIGGATTFTYLGKSLAIQIPQPVMVWVSLGLGVSAIVLCLVNFFVVTATMVAIGNHWDAVYVTTGECDHRGNPQFFNPFEQVSLGISSYLLGMVAVVLMQEPRKNYYLPAWAGMVVVIAGMLSLFHGKRVDSKGLGVFALLWELLSIGACTGAAIFVLLGVVYDVAEIQNLQTSQPKYGLHVASAVFEGVYVFLVFVNIVFAIGVLFRQCRVLCCSNCAGDGTSTA